MYLKLKYQIEFQFKKEGKEKKPQPTANLSESFQAVRV